MPTSWVPNRLAQDLKHHYDLCSSMVPTCLNSDKTHALGSQRYKQSLAFIVLSETVILWTKEGVHNNARISLLLLLCFTFPHKQVKNLTFGGGKELQRRARACSESQKIADTCRSWLEPNDKSGSGCGNQAVAKTWLLWQRKYLQKLHPLAISSH